MASGALRVGGSIAAAAVAVCALGCGGGSGGGGSQSLAFLETFTSTELDLGRWSRAEQLREVANGELVMRIRASRDPGNSPFANNELTFTDANNVNTIRAKVRVDDFASSGPGIVRARLGGSFYNDGTSSTSTFDATGDIYAEVGVDGNGAFFMVARCADFNCTKLEPLSPGPRGRTSLGSVALGTTSTISISFDPSPAAREFTFQLNQDPPVTFDPVAAGAPFATDTPKVAFKIVGTAAWTDPGSSGDIRCAFDDVDTDLNGGNGVYDDFSAAALDPTRWVEGRVRQEIENGALVQRAERAFSGVPDPFFAGTRVRLDTPTSVPLTRERIQADVRVDQITIVEGGSTNQSVRCRTFVSLRYQPVARFDEGSLDFFTVRCALQENDRGGLRAVLTAFGCDNGACTGNGFAIPSQFQSFQTPVQIGRTYTLSVEHVGGGIFVASLDQESLGVNLSSIPSFDPGAFLSAEVRTQAVNTNDSGDSGVIVSTIDNVRVGTPRP